MQAKSNFRSLTHLGTLVPTGQSAGSRKPVELNLVPMIDIFTVLVTFLLMTAVFSRLVIMQLDLPSSLAEPGATTPEFRLEVIVRQEGFELTNGTKLIAAIPKVNDEYDLKTLSELALSLKREYPDANDASVLLELDIEYDHLIQVMDAIRSTEAPETPGAEPTKHALFAQVAVGVAP
jgi:biopolymer transport protein ExbD